MHICLFFISQYIHANHATQQMSKLTEVIEATSGHLIWILLTTNILLQLLIILNILLLKPVLFIFKFPDFRFTLHNLLIIYFYPCLQFALLKANNTYLPFIVNPWKKYFTKFIILHHSNYVLLYNITKNTYYLIILY